MNLKSIVVTDPSVLILIISIEYPAPAELVGELYVPIITLFVGMIIVIGI